MPPSATRKSSRKPVRRASQARSRATVQAIVEAAARILARQGWEGLNTNAIADTAGVSVGSVYEHFPNKHAIVDKLLDDHLAQGRQLIGRGASRAGAITNVRQLVQLLIAGYISLHEDDPALHQALSTEVPLSREQRQRIGDLRNQIIDLVSRALAAIPDADGVSRSPRIAATLMVDTADSLTHRWLVDEAGTPVSSEEMAEELESMLVAYITR